MNDLTVLKGKRILIVDDETDVLEALTDLLGMCQIDIAHNYETAADFLYQTPYDLAIFDIMGVRGYDLLKISRENGIPALMLTARALSPDDFVRSIEGGAGAYIPKEKMTDIAFFVADLLNSAQEEKRKSGRWFRKLSRFFDRQFGADWKKSRSEFRDEHLWLLDE